MTTLRRAAELNTGNYDFLGLSPVIKAMVEAAKCAHELTIWLDMTREEIVSLGEGDDEHDEEPIMSHARDMYDAWELWQRLEQRVAPILARELDTVKPDGDDDVKGKRVSDLTCTQCGCNDIREFDDDYNGWCQACGAQFDLRELALRSILKS